jgi:MFS family permease
VASVRQRFDLFARARSFRFLFLAAFVSGLGTWLAIVALTIDVFDRTGSAKWVSALLIVGFLPGIVNGLLLGPFLDRLRRRRLMIASDLANVAIFAALPFANSATMLVVFAGLSGFANAFFRPVVYAALPNLVDERDLPNANSLLNTVENLTITVGPLVSGVLVAAASPDVVYWINSVSFLASFALVLRIPSRMLQAEQALTRGHWRDLAEGFDLVRRSRPLLTVLATWCTAMFATSAINVAEVVLAKVVFDAGDFGFGLMVGAAGVGLTVGSFAVGSAIDRRGIRAVYPASLALMAIGVAGAAMSPSIWTAAACAVVLGIGNGGAVVSNALLVQRGAPDRLRGRAFTVLMASTQVCLGVGMIVAGRLTDAFGARWVWGYAAAIALVAAAVAWRLTRTIPEPTLEPQDGPAPALAATAEPAPGAANGLLPGAGAAAD